MMNHTSNAQAIDTMPSRTQTERARWEAVLNRDRKFDGKFFFGVATTGIYCRPSCPSRRPRRENVSFYTATEDARRAGLRACLRCKPDRSSTLPEPLEKARHLIESGGDEPLTLQTLAGLSGLSAFHLQREFKRYFGVSPKEYQRAFRMKNFKHAVRKNSTVTDAMFDAGFASSRSFYEKANDALGMAPTAYREGGAKEVLRWAVFGTRLGRVAIAASGRGLCTLEFIESDGAAEELLRHEFSKATLVRDQAALEPVITAVRDLLERGTPVENLPLDLRGTAFQLAVWSYLRKIPAGETRSYTEVARGIRRPAAVRAVARACATNRIAVVVPCHRVVRSTGDTSGYKWGVERKRKLLAAESRRA